jgi:hypothetical protein
MATRPTEPISLVKLALSGLMGLLAAEMLILLQLMLP